MKVATFGLGYVGLTLSACLVDEGHNVYGVDINPKKVSELKNGNPLIDERGVKRRIEKGLNNNLVHATTNASEAVHKSEIGLICVGTPLSDSGKITVRNIYNLMDSISGEIGQKDEYTLVIRSTVPPRTAKKVEGYVKEKTKNSKSINIVVNPEFLREGTAISDFYNPPYIIIGAEDKMGASTLIDLYDTFDIDAPLYVVDRESAEILKIVNNTFHALKICFANEVGDLASEYGINGKEVMELVCEDTKLNISPAYLEPGFSFGGSCLPKDSETLAKLAEDHETPSSVLSNINMSNTNHLRYISTHVEEMAKSGVGIIGMTFKSGVDDVRNSPALRLMDMISNDVFVYDRQVNKSDTLGSNREYFDFAFEESNSKNIAENVEPLLDNCDVIVFTKSRDYNRLVKQISDQVVVDPVGTVSEYEDKFERYETISW
jgi:GDP-mannose 6-dehydrogenase